MQVLLGNSDVKLMALLHGPWLDLRNVDLLSEQIQILKLDRLREAAKVMGQLKVKHPVVPHICVQPVQLFIRGTVERLPHLLLVDAPRLLVEAVVEVVLAVGLWLGPPGLRLLRVVKIVVEDVWQLRIGFDSLLGRHFKCGN